MKCKCGCGQDIPEKGYGKNYLRGHWNKEKRKPLIWVSGYAYMHLPEHPNAWKGKGYIKRSRVVMSKHLARPLEDFEVVHHINGDKSDDRIENLVVTSNAIHTGKHAKERRVLPDKVCPTCGKSFYKGTHHSTAIFCSQKCSSTGNNNAMYGNHNQRYAKLTEKQVKEILSLAGSMSQQCIATKFGTSQINVSRIIRRTLWKGLR
jgi:hypothetical protein